MDHALRYRKEQGATDPRPPGGGFLPAVSCLDHGSILRLVPPPLCCHADHYPQSRGLFQNKHLIMSFPPYRCLGGWLLSL